MPESLPASPTMRTVSTVMPIVAVSEVSDEPGLLLNPRLLARVRWTSLISAGLVVLTGVTGLLGWLVHNDTLKSLLPSHVTLKPNAAIAFVLIGVALSLLQIQLRRALRPAILGLAGLALAIGAATLVEYVLGIDLRIDQLLFHDAAGAIGTVFPGRMASTTALSFMLVSGALLLNTCWPRRHILAEVLTGTTLVTAVAALLGYLSGAAALYRSAFHTQMSLPAALAFVLAAIGVLGAKPDRGLIRFLVSDGMGGFMLRRLLPLAVLLPVLLALLVEWGVRRGVYSESMDSALLALALMVAFAAVMFWNAYSLDRLDSGRRQVERVLRRSRDQWEQTFNCMSEGLSYHDPDYTIVGANEAFYGLVQRDQLAGTKCYQAVHGAPSPPDYCPMRRTLATGKTEASEFFEPRLGRYFHVRTDPVFDSERKIARIVHVTHDVTERKQAEAAMRRLASIVESTDDAVMATDIDGRILSWNRAAERMYGYSATEVERRPETVLCPPELQSELRSVFDRVRTGQRTMSYETQRLRRDGTRFDVALTVSPLYDANGTVAGTSTIARDITERKRADEEIRRRGQEAQQARARLDAVLYSMGEGLYQLDAEGGLVYLNPAAEQMLGYGLEEIRGRNMHELIHSHLPDGTLRPAHECPQVGVIRHGRAYHAIEDYFQRKDGSFFSVEYTSSPLMMDGRAVGAVLSFRDISERKRAEQERAALFGREQQARRELEAKKLEVEQLNTELEQRVRMRTAELEVSNRELEAFSYSVSHDLRAPLRSIDGFSQILLEEHSGNLDPEGQQFLKRVRRASQQMGQLIDALLQLSRVTRSEMRREAVNLSTLARSAAESLRQSASQRQVEFRIADNIRVEGDPRLLQVAMQNLLGNAFKFTSRRERAEIEFGSMVREGKPVLFVRDNGAGFEMAYAHKLFGAFQRLHAASEFEGSGIGLATVQRIIRRHGGQLWAEGEPDKGATFYFTLA